MTKAVIFDLDGTLLDTLSSLAGAWNRSLAQLGFPTHPIDAYRHFIGDGVFQCAHRCLPEDQRHDETIAALVALQREDYGARWMNDTLIYDGVTDALGQLQAQGIRLAALSNKDHQFAVSCIHHFFGADVFEMVLGFSDDVPHKPDPTGANQVREHFALTASDILFVGDTATDMHTASNSNMRGVGVLWGFRDEKELRDAGAAHIISHPSALLELL